MFFASCVQKLLPDALGAIDDWKLDVTDGLPWVSRGPPHRVCAARLSKRSGDFLLGMLCSGALHYQAIWALGVRLLGEPALVELIHHATRTTGHIRGRRIVIWHDERDSAPRSILAEQQNDVYKIGRLLGNLTEEDWIVDLGSHVGVTAIHMLRQSANAKILTVEANPYAYFWMRLNIFVNEPGRQGVALPVAVGSKPSRITLIQDIERSIYSAPLGSLNWRSNRSRDITYDVDVIPFGQISCAVGIESSPSFMKVDCESCEWGLATEWLAYGRMPRTAVGEIHVLCRFYEASSKGLETVFDASWRREVEHIEQCIPEHMTLETFRRAWSLLCEHYHFLMEGCWSPRLRAFHSPEATHVQALAKWLKMMA